MIREEERISFRFYEIYVVVVVVKREYVGLIGRSKAEERE